MQIACVQWESGPDKADNLKKITHLTRQAAAHGAKMIFFPEYSMVRCRRDAARCNEAAESTDGAFVQALALLAQELGVWIAAGMYERSNEIRPYNTVVLLSDTGSLVAAHRKSRLYDAFGYRESDACKAGDTPFVPVPTPLGLLGLATCFELRFPELLRAQVAHGAEVLYLPAGWVAGEHKLLHWRSLTAARAIENRLPVIAPDQCGPIYCGHSCILAPTGETLAAAEDTQAILYATL